MRAIDSLLAYRASVAAQVDEIDERARELEAGRNLLLAKLDGVSAAIELIEAEPDPLPPRLRNEDWGGEDWGGESVPTVPEMTSVTTSLVPAVSAAPTPSRAPRRNIPQLIASALDALVPGMWITFANLSKLLDVQRSQLEKTLAKMDGLDVDQELDQVRRHIEVVSVGLDRGEERGPERRSVEMDASDLIAFLVECPGAAATLSDLAESGFSREFVTAAIARGEVWCDMRGHIHPKIEAAPSSEAAE